MTLQFGKDKTAIIKGFAIVFMIVLHCFGGSEWYDADLRMNHNEFLMNFMPSLKICVGIFTFMVGYGYAFSKNKDISYSCHHIKALLIPYWIILFCFTVPFCINIINDYNVLINNMFGFQSNLSWVNWFIHFYIWSMIIMPFVGRLIDKKPYIFGTLVILMAFVGEVALHQLVPTYQENCYLQTLFNCLLQTPTMVLGYVFARKQLFQKIHVRSLSRIRTKFLVASTIVLFMLTIFFVRSKVSAVVGFNLDFFYSHLMIGCILYLFNQFKMPKFSKMMASLGNNSVYMWFFHGLFFTAAVRSIYQPLIMISTNLWVISIWTILFSYLCSSVLRVVVEKYILIK